LRPNIKEAGACIEVTAAANALFLHSFEQWIAASLACSEKGKTVEERAAKIKESYEKAINANIQYHKEMAALSKDRDSRDLHDAIAKAYSALIQ
jgi:hypothetical protein